MKVFLSPYTFLQDTNVCTYRFTASHQFFQGDLLQDYTLSALIRTHCYSGKKNISMLFFFSFVVFVFSLIKFEAIATLLWRHFAAHVQEISDFTFIF